MSNRASLREINQTHSILPGLCVSDIQGDEGTNGSAKKLSDGVPRMDRGDECDAGVNIDMARRPYNTLQYVMRHESLPKRDITNLCDSPPPGVLSPAERRLADSGSGSGASSAGFDAFGVKLVSGDDVKSYSRD
jgi:hypothetical protein